MEAKLLIETLRTRGVELRINGDGIQAVSLRKPDSNTMALLDEVCKLREEIKVILAAPPCWNCGAKVAETVDIHGRRWWKCWECAVTV